LLKHTLDRETLIKIYFAFIRPVLEYGELGWEPLEARRDKHKLILFYKIVNGIAPQYMYDLIIPFLRTDHRYSLRSSGNNYCLPLCRTTSYYYLTYYMNGNTSFLTVSQLFPSFLHIMKQFKCLPVNNELLHGCQASH
jgi:hypothetical protein